MALHHGFKEHSAFAPGVGYRLLPFRFSAFDGHRYIATNDVGEYVRMTRAELAALVDRQLDAATPRSRALKAKHFLFDDDSRVALDLLALKCRTRAETTAQSRASTSCCHAPLRPGTILNARAIDRGCGELVRIAGNRVAGVRTRPAVCVDGQRSMVRVGDSSTCAVAQPEVV